MVFVRDCSDSHFFQNKLTFIFLVTHWLKNGI